MANSNQELVTRTRNRRWKCLGLVIAAAVTVAVVATVLVLVLRRDDGGPRKESLTLDDFLRRRFTPRQFNASWISDTDLFYDNGPVYGYEPVVFDITQKTKKSAIPANVTLEAGTIQFELSKDGKYGLESYSYRSIYRHSYLAIYNVLDVSSGAKVPLVSSGSGLAQLVAWAPRGNGLAYVTGNNIFYRAGALEQDVQLTFTGVDSTIYHGVPDWVYEEEVLSSNKALWFDPSGTKLAFATYNDTRVPVVTLPYYGRPGDIHFQYTAAVPIRYPKAGAPNPEVTLSVVDLKTKDVIRIEPPREVLARRSGGLDLPVLAVTQWLPDNQSPKLLTVWMNRVQNSAVVEVHDVSNPQAPKRARLAHLTEPKGWIELFEEGATSDGDKARGRVLLPLSHAVGDDSFRHVARFDPGPNGEYVRTDLTTGAFVVTSILSWDSDKGYVYFVSTAPDDPAVSLVQRVRDDPTGAPHEPECLSCNLTDCKYATASLSAANSYIALTCSGPDVPYTVIMKTADKSVVMDWERNEAIRQGLANKALPVKTRMTVPLPDNFTAQVMLWLPPDADLSGSTKYPMLVDVYGGPNSFRVSERFAVDWGTYLSANKSIIYAAIDGRGSANKGDKNIFSLYHRFGTYEVEDQINVTRYLKENLPYIDKTKTAIWGWSYGGYASAMALAYDTQDVFKCGMSVAPVTDWLFYDSIYTERYMGLPTIDEDRAAYRRAQLTNKVDNLRNKQFFLVHGTMDDNVHYQQSMILSRALEEKDILFRQQSYPDEEHGIVNLQPHLYHTLQNFLLECFEQSL